MHFSSRSHARSRYSRWIRTAGLRAALAASALCAAVPAFAAEIWVSVDGTKQGRFAGESVVRGAENKLVALSIQYEVKSPRDAASGQATGRHQHGPICITKEIGAASPQLFQALLSNESLKTVTFEFQRTSQDGRREVYHTVKLTDAVVSAYRLATPAEARVNLEEVCFAFQGIQVTGAGGKSAVDTARQRAAVKRK